MPEYALLKIIHSMWYSLIFVAIIFFISGLDEVFFDLFFWTRYFYRKFKTRKYKPLLYEELVENPEQKIAIFIPCWHEHNVIGEMLTHNAAIIDYRNYDIFVGVYPNDLPTIKAVEKIANILPQIHPVVCTKPGPTNKAENLNSMYDYMHIFEIQNDIRFEIIVLHDSEDLIHPLELKLYNFLIPRKDMVQLPVLPLEISQRNFTHWVYNDEFAEIHSKDVIVREAIKGLVPSAGVATAFSRQVLITLASKNQGQPFSTKSFTEDYDISLRIRLSGLKQIFVFRTIKHTVYKKRWGIFGKMVPKITNEFVATRALFPTEYRKAVRQKARWIMGISMQQWKNVGWPGNFTTRYTLMHDRKTLITHFVNILGYLIFIWWIIYSFWQRYHPEYPSLQEFLNAHRWVWYLIIGCTIAMFERLLQRMIAVYRIYGFIPSLLSIPRAIYSNFLNMHASLRAYWQYFVVPLTQGKSKWEKTDHTFPSATELKSYREKLGSLLVAEKLITQKQLTQALSKQMQIGSQLGTILMQENHLNKKQLLYALAKQYNLPFIDIDKIQILSHQQISNMTQKNYNWLIKNDIFPISLSKKLLTLAIYQPTKIIHNEEITKRLRPYKFKFVLTTRSSEKIPNDK